MNSVDPTQHIFFQVHSILCVVFHWLYIPHYKYLLVFSYKSRWIPFLSCCEWSSKKHECASVSVLIYSHLSTWLGGMELVHSTIFCFVLFFTIFDDIFKLISKVTTLVYTHIKSMHRLLCFCIHILICYHLYSCLFSSHWGQFGTLNV